MTPAELGRKPWRQLSLDFESAPEDEESGDGWMIGSTGRDAVTEKRIMLFTGRRSSSELMGTASADAALIVAAVNHLGALLDVCEAAEALRLAYNGDDAELEMFAKNRLWACLSRLGGT